MAKLADSTRPIFPWPAFRWMVNAPWFHALGSTVLLFVALIAAMIHWDHLTIVIPIAVLFEQLLGMWRKDATRTTAWRALDIRRKKKPTIRDRTPRLWAVAFGLVALPVAAGQYLQARIDQIEAVLPDWIVPTTAAGFVLALLWIEASIRAHEEAEAEPLENRQGSF